MNPVLFVKKAIGRVRKTFFIRRFHSCDLSSGFEKNCKFVGTNHMDIGKNSFFGEGCEIIALDSHFGQSLNPCLNIGSHVRITARGRITCAGNVTIEDDVLMAPDVFITDHNHGMNPTKRGGYSPQPLIVKDVRICEGVWLGQRACVLPGVTIGAHSIIGANSVVTHDIPAYSIAVGSPARVVKVWDNNRWVMVTDNRK